MLLRLKCMQMKCSFKCTMCCFCLQLIKMCVSGLTETVRRLPSIQPFSKKEREG